MESRSDLNSTSRGERDDSVLLMRRPMQRLAGAGLVCALIATTGCGSPNRLSLHQPTAAPSQRHIELTATDAARVIRGERANFVLKFPLPGPGDGPPAFLVFLDMPAPEGVWPVNAEREDCARGFLIQTVGLRRGKTVFHSGEVRVGTIWLSPRRRRLNVDILADDGTRIVGRIDVRDDATEVETFERRHQADVALLKPAPAVAGDGAASGEAGTATNGGETALTSERSPLPERAGEDGRSP